MGLVKVWGRKRQPVSDGEGSYQLALLYLLARLPFLLFKSFFCGDIMKNVLTPQQRGSLISGGFGFPQITFRLSLASNGACTKLCDAKTIN